MADAPTTAYTEVQIDDDSISLTLISESGSNGPVIEDTERFTFEELQDMAGEHLTLALSDDSRTALADSQESGLPEVGQVAIDRNAPSWSVDDRVEVVEVLDARADEYVIQGRNEGEVVPRAEQDWTDESVADANPSYDEDEPVVLGIYRDSVPQYSDGTIAGHDDSDVYAFPAGRIEEWDAAGTTMTSAFE